MALVYHTALVLTLPPHLSTAINAIRSVHDRHFPRWMPHMTLLFPFVDQPITPQNLAPLSQTLSKLPSFDVTLSTIDYFVHSPQSCTIVLRPQSASSDVSLGDLQSACVAAFPLCTHQSSRAGGFTPHITLGQAKSRAQAESMVEQWRAKGLLDPILGATFGVLGVDWIRRDGKDSDFYVVTTVNVGTT